jgi:hypothetical protein
MLMPMSRGGTRSVAVRNDSVSRYETVNSFRNVGLNVCVSVMP